jgi:hypothetical protein
LLKNAKASYPEIHYFETDKEVYYYDEHIKLNVSWTLEYNEQLEYCYVRMVISNKSGYYYPNENPNEFLWKSPIYDNEGTFQKEYVIDICNFNLTFENSDTIYVKFFCAQEIPGENNDYQYLRVEELTILRRNISCELLGFNNLIFNFNPLNFTAKLTAYPNLDLAGYLITVRVCSKGRMVYQKNYTTDLSGMINITICNYTIGENILLIELQGDKLYNPHTFHYSFSVSEIMESETSNKSEVKESQNDAELVLFIVSASSIGGLMLFILYHKVNNRNKKNLADLATRF